MTRYMIILNPIAGAGTAIKAMPRIKELMSQYELNYDISLTDYPGHAIDLARKAAADGYEYIIAAGGDGTSNEVLNGLMQHKQAHGSFPVMGVIPVGRGNDFAFGADIPVNIDEACSLLASLPRKWIDIGTVSANEEKQVLYFGNGIGVGFDAVVGFVAAKSKLKGMLSYLVAAIKTIFKYFKPPEVSIEVADRNYTVSALMVSVMNGRRMGGGFMMAPTALINDQLFNLVIVSKVPQLAMFGLIGKFMKGTHDEDPAVQTCQGDHVTVTALKGTLPVHADGVTVCEAGHSITINLIPRGLELISKITP